MNEETSLLVSQHDSDSQNNQSALDDEGPWPNTFKRSIGLLAGPQTNVDNIYRLTRSPRVVPIQATNARIKLKKLGRGYQTPDPVGHRIAASPGNDDSFAPMKKTHSLDYSQVSSGKASLAADRQQKKKDQLAKAALYRQKILASATTAQSSTVETYNDEEMHSPGYHREKASDKHKLKQQEEAKKSEQGDSSFWQCVFNMANILMGVGMLGLPYIFKAAGWIGGFLVTLGFGAITWRTSILIGRELNGDPRPASFFDSPTVSARMRNPVESFPEIANECFGQFGTIVLSFILYFELFSCLCIFFVSIGDHLHTLFPQISMAKCTMYTGFIIFIPAVILRTPRLLSYLSLVGTISTIIVVLTVGFSALNEGDISDEVVEEKGILIDEPNHIFWDASGLPLGLGLIAYAFSGHAIVPNIYNSMERPQDFEKVIHASYIIVLSCSLIVALGGYYMFGAAVDDQVTISLDLYSSNPVWSMTALAWLMILTAFSKTVLSLFPLALGTEEIIAPFIHTEEGMATASGVIKVIYIFLSIIVAVYVPSFSFVCTLVGLICTITVSVVFPAAAHLNMFGPKISIWDKIFDWTLVIGGIYVAIVGTIATL